MTKQIGFHIEDEQEWEKALRELEEREGELIPETVVKEASDEDSPLHSQFTWDDTEASRLYREEQARGLIRRVKVKWIDYGTEDESEVRQFICVTRPDNSKAYVRIQSVLSEEELRRQMIEGAKREMLSFKAKYSMLEELSEFFKAIDAQMV